MANTTNTKYTCGDCAFFKDGYCARRNTQSRAIYYACDKFQTPAEYAAYIEQLKKERADRQETRLNFLLTGVYIAGTTTQILLEYFDSFFNDVKVERNWRFERKRAAKEITDCANRMRTLFHHTFGQDQMKVMTAHGTKAFDCEAYDNHEQDARHAALNLLYHLDRCWQNEVMEQHIHDMYKALPDNGIFEKQDYEHFAK
jgi:hypothetical protein